MNTINSLIKNLRSKSIDLLYVNKTLHNSITVLTGQC